MGTNKRYAEQINRRVEARTDEIAARPATRQPPVYVNDGWVLVRNGAAVARVTTIVLGYRDETFYRVELRDGTEVGYFPTLEAADRAI